MLRSPSNFRQAGRAQVGALDGVAYAGVFSALGDAEVPGIHVIDAVASSGIVGVSCGGGRQEGEKGKG